MELTQEILDRFKGGQAEIQNEGEGYLYRGEIADIYVSDDNTLNIHFVWLGKMDPPMSGRWVNDTTLGYAASLEIYSVSDIGNGRIALNGFINNELTVLYPPDGSKLDPAKVEGLELTKS
jgi:hypothetical protein